MKNFLWTFIFALCLSSIFPCSAYAYLDLGTGSYIMQLVAAFIVGSLFALKIFWAKIITFFKGLFLRSKKQQ